MLATMAPISRSRSQRRHAPLDQDLTATAPLRARSKKRKARPDVEDQGYVDSRASRKILKIGQDLVDEEHQENLASAPNPAFTFESRFGAENDSEEGTAENSEEEAWVDEADDVVEEVVCPGVHDERVLPNHTGIQEVDPNDLNLFNKFMPSDTSDPVFQPTQNDQAEEQGTNLADLILKKIAAHEAVQDGQPVAQGGGMSEDAVELPAKVVEVYSK